MHEPAPHDPFEADYLADLVDRHFGDLLRDYFRPRFVSGHRLPQRGPAILAGNHSGTAFPWDAMALDCLLWQREGMPEAGKCRSVFEKELSMAWWMRPFGIDDFWRRCGGVDMTFDNFDRLLERGDRVIYYPEGVPGIGKGFGNRYRLQRFSSSFVTLAAKHRAPVHPVYIVNAEWVIPFNYTLAPLDWLVERLFRVPFLPLPAAPLVLLFPWMWYLSLPARLIFVSGDPLHPADLVTELGGDPDEADLDTARLAAERIRALMQVELDRLVERYGGRPYAWRSLRVAVGRARRQGRLAKLLPWGWPWAFLRHHRDRSRPPARNRLHSILRDLDIFAWYLPLGWALLSVFRRLRRPPYGYRGLTREERHRREGRFHWHLARNPLPPAE